MIPILGDLFFSYTYFFSWRDALEILFFTTIIYYFSLWLKKDRQKNLLGYFYAYCLVAFVAYHAQLSALTFLLAVTSPVMLMLFILMHQTTLQKNFIALRTITPAHKETTDWLETLMRSCLIALNNNKEILCVLEHTDSLQDFLSTPLIFRTPLHEQLLDIIINSNSYTQERLLWITTGGILQGINAQWNTAHLSEAHVLSTWQDNALFFTSKTDALVFHLAPNSRLFTIIVHGKEFSTITSSQALIFIKKHCAVPRSDSVQGAKKYEHSLKQSHKQPYA